MPEAGTLSAKITERPLDPPALESVDVLSVRRLLKDLGENKQQFLLGVCEHTDPSNLASEYRGYMEALRDVAKRIS